MGCEIERLTLMDNEYNGDAIHMASVAVEAAVRREHDRNSLIPKDCYGDCIGRFRVIVEWFRDE